MIESIFGKAGMEIVGDAETRVDQWWIPFIIVTMGQLLQIQWIIRVI